MAETAVLHLLANLAPFLQGEVNLLSGVREAIEDIRVEFERMSAFLRVADAMEERDPELKAWVKLVRDAAYDTEYVLDKLKLHLAQHHGDGFGGFLRKSFYFAKTLKALHQIASEIQRIKSRVIDISKRHNWEAIKHMLPDKNYGSRVILTTRFADIASTCCEETDGHVYTLMPLSQEESWTLFCNKTFRGNLCPPNLKQISLRILERCAGLPLAIVAISGVLATKDQSRIDEWERLYRRLGAELEGNDELESMEKALSLSYNDLPYYLKFCFLYLSIFSDDPRIWCRTVIRLWTAEGFVNAIEGKTIEEVANGYLNELFNRSLIQVAKRYPDGRPSHFHIHDLMRSSPGVNSNYGEEWSYLLELTDEYALDGEVGKRLNQMVAIPVILHKVPESIGLQLCKLGGFCAQLIGVLVDVGYCATIRLCNQFPVESIRH
ncbi:hypothetical protein ACSBR1_030776 [Camellia fascicularis]